MFVVKLTARAKKELKTIPVRYKDSLSQVFEELRDDPLSGKPLTRELAGHFSYKIGVLRIIYRVNRQNRTVLILTAGHRSTIYN